MVVCLRPRGMRIAGRACLGALLGLMTCGSMSWASPITPETVGRWQYKDASRPVKIVVIGGSVSAWPRGGFSQFIQKACARVEVKNRGKARIGGRQLRERFTKQVLKNRRVDPDAYEGMWLVFLGGLNSVGTPEMTNRDVSRIFRSAHDAGIHTMGLTLTPWGSERDKRRWAGAKGLAYQKKTRLAVDYMMGRLTPTQALGRYARGRESADWLPGELPDVSVELYDSSLRDAAAPLRDETRSRRSVMRVPSLRKQLRALPEPEQEPWLSETLERVREIPRW